jgi:hypothetical protein
VARIKIDLLKQRVAERYDPDYLVDVLDITSEELLEAFEDKLLERRYEFDEVEDSDESL